MITVIIPHHLNENQDILDWTLESVLKQETKKEVFVIADSQNKPKVPAGVKLIWRTDGSLNYCPRKSALGVQLSSPESSHFFFGSDDIILGRNCLENMKRAAGSEFIINALSNCDDINILKQEILDITLEKTTSRERLKEKRVRDFIHGFQPMKDSQFVIPTNRLYMYGTMMPRVVHDTCGGHDATWEGGWCDEDWSLRAASKSVRLALDCSSYIFHIGSATWEKYPHNEANKEKFKARWGVDLIPPMTMPGIGLVIAASQKYGLITTKGDN